MKEYELKNLRRRREKHFLQKDGSIIAKVYDDDVHFLKDGKYENIDNTLIKSGYYYRNKHNEFNVYYNEANQYLTQIRKGEHYLDVRLSGVNKLSLKKDGELIVYDNALPNINFKYAVVGNKIKEIIELIERPAINKISFIIETDLSLSIKDNYIEAKNDLKNIFIIDKAYMYDKNNEFNYNIYYNLEKIKSNIYELDLILDDDWLNNCKYPVIIDPTISSQTNENSVYDTYIFPGDDGINKNNYDVLKAGVEKVDNEYITNRALLKFDLPKIGTGSQIIKAELNLIGYPILGYSQSTGIVNIHQITAPWDEETASWRDMHDKFKPRIEGSIESVSSEYWPYTEEELRVFSCSEDITNMVRKCLYK